jgi:hypothetical protein
MRVTTHTSAMFTWLSRAKGHGRRPHPANSFRNELFTTRLIEEAGSRSHAFASSQHHPAGVAATGVSAGGGEASQAGSRGPRSSSIRGQLPPVDTSDPSRVSTTATGRACTSSPPS